MLNCLRKILEKLMATRLAYMAERYSLLHENQVGGRAQRSAIDACLALTHDIDRARISKEVVSMLLMDVKGAFDNCSLSRLVSTLHNLGVPIPVRNWVKHFLTNRTTALSFDGKKEEQLPVVTGIPQGSPASPILFLLYLRPLFDILDIEQRMVWTPSYIDDVALVVTGKNQAANCRRLEAAARVAFKWAENNAVAFDDSKTELMHFHNRHSNAMSDDDTVTLPNQTVVHPETNAVRWIGVWFDRKLSFKQHVQKKTASAARALGALSRLSNTEDGLSPAAVRQLYISCVIPVGDFGVEVWWNQQKHLLHHYEVIHNAALRKILGAFRTTPIHILQTEGTLPPVKTRFNHYLSKYAIRTINMPESHPIRQRCPTTFPPFYEDTPITPHLNGDWTEWDERPRTEEPAPKYQTRLIRILSTIGNIINRYSEVETYSTTASEPWIGTTIQTYISTADKKTEMKEHRSLIERLHQNEDKQLIAYTDGSKLSDNLGAGCHILPFGDHANPINSKHFLGFQCEVYDAELFGMLTAASTILGIVKQKRLGNKSTNQVWAPTTTPPERLFEIKSTTTP